MPFSSDSYYRNKYRREALQYLADARMIKLRMADGTARAWEPDRLPHLVRMARLCWRSYLSYRGLCQMRQQRTQPLLATEIKCDCGAIVTFEANERHARCFDTECGRYHHR